MNLLSESIKISIVIPTLNEAERIGDLVTYLLGNGQGHLAEIIVVDGGSCDDTKETAAAAGAKVTHIQCASRAKQMNEGASIASGHILYFVHADSIPPSTFAADILAEIKAGTSMGCFRYKFDSSSLLLKFNAWFVRFKWLCCQGGDKTFFIRKEVFWEFQGYDETFVVMEEYNFLTRAMKQYPLRIIPKNAVVSARKYEKNSWLRVQIANFTAFTMFRLGLEPCLIRDAYKRILK